MNTSILFIYNLPDAKRPSILLISDKVINGIMEKHNY